MARRSRCHHPLPCPSRRRITSEAEEEVLEALNDWMESQGLPRGNWPTTSRTRRAASKRRVRPRLAERHPGKELSEPVAVLLNETAEVLSIASRAGYRCFTDVHDFQRYVEQEILAVEVGS